MNVVAVVGGINLDIVIRAPRIPRAGETVGGGRLARYPGGKGSNQAVAAARAGASVSLIGAVGSDEGGTLLQDSLRAAGVDIVHLQRFEGVATGTAAITVDPAGANAITVAEGANGCVDAEAARQAVSAVAPDVLLLQCEVPPDVTRAALAGAPTGALRVLNASPLEIGKEPSLESVDLLVVNEIEAAVLAGHSVDSSDALAVARELAARVIRGCVLTLGARGAVASLDGRRFELSAHPVNVVDTTGAGDAFCGTLAAALAAGLSLSEALDWANAAGALATTRPGAQPSLPAAAEIEELLRTAFA